MFTQENSLKIEVNFLVLVLTLLDLKYYAALRSLPQIQDIFFK